MSKAKSKPKPMPQPQPKSKIIPMTREAVTRIVKHTAEVNEGKIPAKSFATRVDRTLQQREAANLQGVKLAGRPSPAPHGAQAQARRAGRTGS